MAPSTQQRILVTGAAGMLGSHIVEMLLKREDVVIGVDNLSTGSASNLAAAVQNPNFTFIEADISEGIPVAGALDAVLHLASPASPLHFKTMPLEILRVGSIGTLNALDLADRSGAKYLFASSSEVYGEPEVHPQNEAYLGNVNTLGERSCYDESKRFGEAAADTYRRDRHLDIRIVRIFNTYGPRNRADDGRVVPNFITQALANKPLSIFGDGSQTRSYCFVTDQAAGILLLLASSVTAPVNIGNPTEFTVLELAEMVLRLTGSTAGVTYLPLPQNDPARRRPDISRATQLLGWEPTVDLQEGLSRTVAYFQAV
ncbi:MAG: NAD-dependent epimerase/dehydratase family protein [Microthrixaceae bacterium]